MLKGNIHKLPENLPNNTISSALHTVQNISLSDLPLGRQEVDGERLFINVVDLTTAPAAERWPEAHNKYADIHIVLDGMETIGVRPRVSSIPIEKDLLETEDSLLYPKTISDEQTVTLYPGDFLVCMPEDIHRPGCCKGKSITVRKAIVKVLL